MLLVETGAVCSLCNCSITSCIVVIMTVVGSIVIRSLRRLRVCRAARGSDSRSCAGADGHGGKEPTVLAAIARRREVRIEESSADSSRAEPAGAGVPDVQWTFEIELRGSTWLQMNLDLDRGCADRPLLTEMSVVIRSDTRRFMPVRLSS